MRGDVDWNHYDCMLQLVERFDMDLHKNSKSILINA